MKGWKEDEKGKKKINEGKFTGSKQMMTSQTHAVMKADIYNERTFP